MNSQTTQGNFPLQTLDLSASLSYGLFYQPVIGSNLSSSIPVTIHFSYLHRHAKCLDYQKRNFA